jgi:cytoskeletal protein CcmA (bactofilin family)
MARAANIVQANTRISGRIEGSGDLDVLGTVQGAIVIDGDLLVDGDARVDADVQAAKVDIHGIFTGNVQADRIELFENAIVVGDLRAAAVIVAEGAKFRGLIDMGEFEASPKEPARASGRASRGRTATARKPSRKSKPAKSSKAAKASKAPEAEPAEDDE